METAALRFFDATVRLEITLWASAEAAVSESVGLKLGSVWALRAIASSQEPPRVQELAVALGVTVGAVSKIVDRLEVAGLVERRPHERDGRSHYVAPTKLGERTLRTAMRALTKAIAASLPGADSEAEVERLATDLERITGVRTRTHARRPQT